LPHLMADHSSVTALVAGDTPHIPKVEYSQPHPAGINSSLPKPTWPTMDRDERDEWSKFVYPEVNTEIESEDMLLKLCPTYHSIGIPSPEPPKMTKTRKRKRGDSTYCLYLNELSEFVRDKNCSYNFCNPEVNSSNSQPHTWSSSDATSSSQLRPSAGQAS